MLSRVHSALILLLIPLALCAVFMYVPTEKQMGIVQRIFYFHVPSAMSAYLAFFIVCLSSIQYLRTRAVKWDHIAVSAAELGVAFSLIMLTTGPLWAKPIWGVYWRWEPRLTSMLIMFTTYVAYLMVRTYGNPSEQTRRFAAVLGICGFANVPLVHYSVRLWSPQHQLHPTENTLIPAMEHTLYLCFVAIFLLFAYLLRRRVELERIAHAVAHLEQRISSESPTEGT
tara:strand:- start:90 stop:770 length:681 start_codon:yes stop_codon:yes gene_type:complete